MGLAQWFWRLFFVIAALLFLQALVVSGIALSSDSASVSKSWLWQLWLSAFAVIGCAAVATWYIVRKTRDPLAELMRQAQALSPASNRDSTGNQSRDELGVLAGAFDQMQRDLARRHDQIQHHGERLQAVLSSMADGVLAVGADSTILLANDAGRQLLDFVTPEPIGRPLLEVTRARPVYEAVHQAFVANQSVVVEFDAPGVTRRTLSLRATRLPGTPCPGVMVVVHDMTELRRLENLRRELVANVSHELKTPLTAIKVYAETLRLGAISDPEHNLEFVRRIEEQADHLHELILDILQIARIESGQPTAELADVAVAGAIDACIQQFASAAAAKQLAFKAENIDRSLTVRADEEGLHTILSNLVDNAIKYTPSGGSITIRAAADEAQVAIEVQDTGIGIAEKEQSRIFERFYRVDKARSRELGGTGLGLSIVKHLAQTFGGSVSVTSHPGRGSTFRIELPRA